MYDDKKINKGDSIKFKLKSIEKGKGNNYKFILSQKENVVDPWLNVTEKYKVPCSVKGKITKVVNYGIFIEIESGISGLLHINEYKDLSLNTKEGEEITVKLFKIEPEEKKVFFTL